MSVPGASNTELLEREAERARMRLAESIEKLASPSTNEAVKQQISGYGQRLKDQVLQHAQEAKDGVIDKAREAGREKATSLVDEVKRRASENPLGVALIGAGIAWHFYKKPPVTTLLVGAGAAMLMRSGQSESSNTRGYRDPYREDQPRGYVPGGVAGLGYPEDSPGMVSTMTQNLTGAATQAADDARQALAGLADQAREVGSGVVERASNAVEQAGELVRSTADRVSTQASEATSQLVETARDFGGRARDAAQGAISQVSGMGTTPSSGPFEDEFAEPWEGEDRATNRMGFAPWAIAAAGLVAGMAAYGYLRSAERLDEDDIWDGNE
jgi:hypothetical protein